MAWTIWAIWLSSFAPQLQLLLELCATGGSTTSVPPLPSLTRLKAEFV